jgi:hypothetical protein
MARRHLPVAPLGRYAPRSACLYCGARVDDGVELVKGVDRGLHALRWRCVDVVACLRRKQARAQLRLPV